MSCHPAHAGRMLKSCGFSRQKPALRAAQRDGEVIRDWRERRFPATGKRALAGGRTILWADGSGFYLLPALLRAWAPAARTPVIRRKPAHEHLSAISITGELYLAAQAHSYKGPDVIRFLEQLLREIPGKLLLIWDGAPVHCSRAAKEWLSQGASRRIRLEQLPGYAPELNPDEGVWRCPKRVELRNLVCSDLGQLTREFWNAAKRLLGKPEVLRPCIKEVSYVW